MKKTTKCRICDKRYKLPLNVLFPRMFICSACEIAITVIHEAIRDDRVSEANSFAENYYQVKVLKK